MKVHEQRKDTRFDAENGDVAFLDSSMSTDQDFTPQIPGLILNESYSGALLVITTNRKMELGMHFAAKVGRLGVMPAEVKWVSPMEDGIYKIGIEYLT